ncbi:MAG TPA: Fe-S-containing hydro-lyase [Bacillota bacterium]|nr:Fe-S-containing hydro-lyase [Bacillota bacterium]
MEWSLNAPFTVEEAKKLRCGDTIYLSGTVYTARDAAHKKLYTLLLEDKPLPFELYNSVIYYVGPTPAKPGHVIGSAGPTTSYRMDKYAPSLLDNGLRAMIGKGKRSTDVLGSCMKNSAVYFGAVGGCGALLSKCITSSEIIAYPELGSECIRRLTVERMPLCVIIDTYGNCLYDMRHCT